MKIVLKEELCTGHGRCYALSPDVYDADDQGHCIVRITGDVPPELEAAARIGASNCPEDALIIEE
jgi:ferredoxin